MKTETRPSISVTRSIGPVSSMSRSPSVPRGVEHSRNAFSNKTLSLHNLKPFTRFSHTYTPDTAGGRHKPNVNLKNLKPFVLPARPNNREGQFSNFHNSKILEAKKGIVHRREIKIKPFRSIELNQKINSVRKDIAHASSIVTPRKILEIPNPTRIQEALPFHTFPKKNVQAFDILTEKISKRSASTQKSHEKTISTIHESPKIIKSLEPKNNNLSRKYSIIPDISELKKKTIRVLKQNINTVTFPEEEQNSVLKNIFAKTKKLNILTQKNKQEKLEIIETKKSMPILDTFKKAETEIATKTKKANEVIVFVTKKLIQDTDESNPESKTNEHEVDPNANKARVELINKTKKIVEDNSQNTISTWREVANLLPVRPDNSLISELVKGRGSDGSYTEVVHALSKMGRIFPGNITDAIVRAIPAVRKRPKAINPVTKEDVKRVLGGATLSNYLEMSK